MSQDQGKPLRQEKIRKRQELLKRGVNPYPHDWSKKRASSVQLIKIFKKRELASEKSEAGQEKTQHIAGRLMRKRGMGKAAFFNIQDEFGELQCYIKKEDFFNNSHKESGETSANNNSYEESRETSANNNSYEESRGASANNNSYEESAKSPLNSWEIWKLSDIGDILGLSGELFRTKKGEISLRVKSLRMLCKSLETLPEKYHGLEDKELKYRYRHLDLVMSKKSREVFKTRSKIIREIRSFMNKKGFMEVETPVLQSLYGGAVATPFETYFRRLNNQKMYLKISPEIYLKKLIVGGFEKVFEIGKNFRNEGLDRSHNPEFTMMEYYEAYTDYKDQMKFFEELICHVAVQIKKEDEDRSDKRESEGGLKFLYQGRELDLTPPWIQISPRQFEDLLCSLGSCSNEGKDKTVESFIFEYQGKKESPKDFFEILNKKIQEQREDRESFFEITDKKIQEKREAGENFSEVTNKSIQEQREAGENFSEVTNKSIQRQKTNSKLDFKKFWEEIRGAKRGQKRESPIQMDNEGKKEETKLDREQMFSRYKLLLAYANYIEPEGNFKKFDQLLNQHNDPSAEQISSYKEELSLMALELTVEKYFWHPVFIMDFPIKVSPLTKAHRSQPGLVERFEPYMAGMEIGNAYTELNDPLEQKERLEKQERYSEKKTAGKDKLKDSNKSHNIKEEAEKLSQPIDKNFLHALEVGMPPTGGVGLGIERLVMILTDQNHIKDSMLFPVLREK